ncbi:YggS family pyridoxal phosphate-dependent enzyme [Ectothiorhodospiraceae bacterium BW-2]|nr:YggS family pyridoxal phosphate-dependent enzyme [Ectothiorhodospiraceae bacterium BW-2]
MIATPPQPLTDIRERISAAATAANRSPTTIELIAVSKRKPIDAIIAAYEAGVRHFGENRTEELVKKREALRHLPEIRWHFIGQLQSRQSEEVARYADYFHALDRLKIATRLNSHLQRLERRLPLFIQINISGEVSKSGLPCHQWQHNRQQWQQLQQFIAALAPLSQLQPMGLMTMAPLHASPAELQRLFHSMAALSAQLHQQQPELNMRHLSMGMSGDFELAIAAGATHVRIGSAIFGSRTET